MYAILGLASLTFVVVCAVHAVKTGRAYYWLWIILFFSIPGCLIYFFVEMLPDLRRNPAAKRMGSDLITVVAPGRNLRKLQEQLEITDTVSNRQALARYHLQAGQFDEAIDLYQTCLHGVFKDDPGLTLELSYALFHKGNFEEAKGLLGRLIEAELGTLAPERDLLYARTLEQLGDIDASLVAFEAILRKSTGEETHCRYAMLLEKAGRTDEAREVYIEIVKGARRSPAYYRRAQKQWITTARQAIDRLR